MADITQVRSQIEGLRIEAINGDKGCEAEQLEQVRRVATHYAKLVHNLVCGDI